MKKILIVNLVVLLVLFFCSCGAVNTSSNISLTDKYLKLANECIEKGDFDKALKILEEGIDVTGDERLSQKLNEIKSKSEDSSSKQDNSSQESKSESSTVSNEIPSQINSVPSSSDSTSSKEESFKLSENIINALNSSKTQLFGSKTYDYYYEGGEAYYSSDKNYAVLYPMGAVNEKPSGIIGNIDSLISGKKSYSSDELKKIFANCNVEEGYSDYSGAFYISVNYNGYNTLFEGDSANNYTTFTISN